MNDLMRHAFGSPRDPAGGSEASLREADCPSPEVWHELASGFVGEARTVSSRSNWTASRLEAHAAACGACSAELEMARVFVDEARAVGVTPESVSRPEAAAVVSLHSVRAARQEEAKAPRRGSASTLLAAAAVLLALVAGYATWVSRAPEIQGPGSGAVMRGNSVTLLEPLDEIDESPSVLDWEPAEGADSYLVQVTRLDGRVVIRREVAAPPIQLTIEEQANLMPRVRYEWEVRALAVQPGEMEQREVLQTVSSSFTILGVDSEAADGPQGEAN